MKRDPQNFYEKENIYSVLEQGSIAVWTELDHRFSYISIHHRQVFQTIASLKKTSEN